MNKGKARKGSNVLITQTLVGFAEKANTLAADNLQQVPFSRTSLPLMFTIRMNT